MKKSVKNNGSALLMVVGLLTILAMLGSTFLIIASTHRKVASNVIAASPLNEAPSGIAAEVAQLLKKDLYLDALGPYSLAKGSVTDDEYLGWPADTATSDVLKQPLKAVYNIAQGTYDGYTKVDTDGDLIADAALVPIPNMYNENGVQIYVAVSVVDLSRMLNVNTSGEVGLALSPSTPAEIYLKEFLNADLRPYYAAVHSARCGSAGQDLPSYSIGAALKAGGLPASSPYSLYTIDDELQLRWQGYCSGANVGRLYNVLHTFSKAGYLTTASRSRSLLRHPTAAIKKQLQLYNWNADQSAMVLNRALLDDDATRTWFYEQLKKALSAAGGTGGGDEDESDWVDPPAGTSPIIVDNSDAGVTFAGTWTVSTSNPVKYGADYRHDGNTGKGTKSASYAFPITTKGKYEVSVYKAAADSGKSSNTPVEIVHSKGTAAVTLNQTTNAGTWEALGQFVFEAGSTGVVRLNTAGTTAYVVADAVQFVLKKVPPPPPTPPDPWVIDNPAAVFTGAWTVSSSSAVRYGANYHHDGNTGKGTKIAEYSCIIPVSGKYEIAIYKAAADSGKSATTPIDIEHADGSTTVTLNQTTNPGVFEPIGQYRFTKNSTATVKMRTAGTVGFVVADAIQFTCKEVETTGGGGEADTGPVDHFVANLWAYLSNLDPLTHAFHVGKAFGVVPQLAITEAFAKTYPESGPGAADQGWAFAIEVMNPTTQSISLSNYAFSSGTANEVRFSTISGCPVNLAAGAKMVLYSFGGKNKANRTQPAAASDAALFNVAPGANWYRIGTGTTSLLDFAQANASGGAIKVYRIVTDGASYVIPVDSVTGADIGYTGSAPQTDAETPTPLVGQRDDSWAANFGGRGRALVAAMDKKGSHSLGQAADNGITAESINSSPVSQGFFIRKGETFPATLGDVIARFIVGPEAETAVTEYKDLPHQLLAKASSQTRGKLDYKGDAPAAWTKDYPNINFACVVPELLQMLPTHDTVANGVLYGLININTADKKVLTQLPFPLTLKMGTTDVAEWNNNRAKHVAAIADAIIAKRGTTPYTTPGAVAADIVDYARTKVLGATTGLGYYEAQNALWNSVSNCVTVNSDVYAVYMRVQLGSAGTLGTKYFVAIIDRSNCKLPTDQPTILMTTRVE
ncbi:MAG: hypothetical protein LLG01_16390 [Planctomycetaceae bacterium]|nr:hypothetical protein [Planctomycetaceae bacterium]